MRTVIDNFMSLFEDIKSESGVMDPLRSVMHPLNSVMHPLKSSVHPYRSMMHPLNSIMNQNRATERLRAIRDMINDYVLGEVSLKKQSSSQMSTLASKVLRGYRPTLAEAQSLAASVLSQDEIKGKRSF